MASLAYGPCSPELRTKSMEVSEARPWLRHLFGPRSFSCPWLLGSEMFLSPYVHHQIQEHVCKFTLHMGHNNSLTKAPVLSLTKGNSNKAVKVQCKVVWIIEADLTDDQLLYITGDSNVLGSWEPELAILMSPTEHCNFWKAEVKIGCGINFKYNYFIKGVAWPSCDIIWRHGPECSLSIPQLGERGDRIVVRDTWMRFDAKRASAPLWGSWMEETNVYLQPLISAPARDDDNTTKSLSSDSLESKQLSDSIAFKDKFSYNEETATAINRKLSVEDEPVEEPWLVQSVPFFPTTLDNMGFDVYKNKDTMQDEVNQLGIHNQNSHVVEQLLPEEGGDKIPMDDSISTIILINSSICTMQRIAVVEDGKLVELLLEPVKNNVQCDSVYLGFVTKLVPHMGGAFVNIGISRPSLMDIKRYREPFIFPPFRCGTREKEVDSSVGGMHSEHLSVHETDCTSHEDVEAIDDFLEVDFEDEPVHFMNDEFEEHEVENDFYVPEVLKRSLNGALVNYNVEDADFEDYIDVTEQQLEGDNSDNAKNPCSLKLEAPNGLQLLDVSGDMCTDNNKWSQVQNGTKIIVQVVKEGMGTKGPTLTAYPKLKSRFWILATRCNRVGVSKKIFGVERTRLRVIAKTLQPQGFGLTVRTVAAGHSLDELHKDLQGLLSTWKNIMEHAKSAALAADEGVEGAVPAILHRAMGQTLSIVQDYFNEKVQHMIVDSPRTYHEVTNYLQEIAPELCDRVELYNKRIPLFDEFNVEEEINNILSKRVPLANGGSLVIEQTEALVSIDVNGGHGMLGNGTSQEKAILDVNLAAAKQIARELRLRDIGGIIVVDFIDMMDDSHKRLVYEEVKKAVEIDRSMVKVSELSKRGLMEITRKRVRPSVTFKISEPCPCCHATGRVEALETAFSKVEHEICRLLAMMDQKADPENPKSWPRFILRVDQYMSNYLTSGKKTKLATLSSSLKVWILLKVARRFTRGTFEVKLVTDDKVNNQPQAAISILHPAEVRTRNPSRQITLFPVKKSKALQK